MWLSEPEAYARLHGTSFAQARRMQCTAEHVIAKCDGGTNALANIVAACLHCNSGRHRAKLVLNSERFRDRVQRLLTKRKWHDPWVFASHL
jgi:hypothetical protein